MKYLKKVFRAGRNYARLDHFLTECLSGLSRSKIEKLIKEGLVTLNDEIVNRKNREVFSGAVVAVELPQPEEREFAPSRELDKLFEDAHLLIIDKPSGISVHPGDVERGETILDIFTYYYPQIKQITNSERPGIVHRLDKETSGLMLLAKDEITMKRLQKQFKRRQVKKTYLALAAGRPRLSSGTIDVPIMRSRRNPRKFAAARHEESEAARQAITEFTVIREFKGFSYLKVFPLTGRTHQIRVHLAHIGCPVLGDRVYGRSKGPTFPRLALHAHCLEFLHPITGLPIFSCSPLPRVFRDYLKSNY